MGSYYDIDVMGYVLLDESEYEEIERESESKRSYYNFKSKTYSPREKGKIVKEVVDKVSIYELNSELLDIEVWDNSVKHISDYLGLDDKEVDDYDSISYGDIIKIINYLEKVDKDCELFYHLDKIKSYIDRLEELEYKIKDFYISISKRHEYEY